MQRHRAIVQGLLKLANIQWNGMQFQVRVRNISTGGAMVEGDRILPIGSSVQLDLPEGGSVGAEVRWAETRRMGLQFDEAFDLASELAWAATQAGLGEEEIRRTLASAFGARGLRP
jgi:hypothetical protein